MRFGVYFDLRNPPEWRTDWSRLYGFTLEACQEAERLGADSAWFSEHHLFDDGYLNQPFTFMAAVATRTERMRLGTAILIAPIRKPAQIAEEAAVVDLLSNGRVDIGLGTGYRVPEFDLFGATLEKKYAQTDAIAREIRRLWDTGTLVPPPAQERVPIWMGYQGPQGARRAGLLGEGLLSANPDLVEPYLAGLEEAGHGKERARMAGSFGLFVTEDPERDWPAVAKHAAYQANSYRRHMVMGTDQPVPRTLDPERMREKGLVAGFHGILCDTPEKVADELRSRVAGTPVEELFFFASIGGMSEELTMQHVQTICTKLKPLLADL